MAPTSAVVTHVAEAFSLPESLMAITVTAAGVHGNLLPDGDPVADLLASLKNATKGSSNVGTTVVGSVAGGLASSVPSGGSISGKGPGGGNPAGGSLGAGAGAQQVAPQRLSDPAKLATLHGLPLLQQLSLLSGGDISNFVAKNPSAVDALLAAPPAAREIELWWNDMGVDARAALVTSAPRVVGNLDGTPFTVRDLANRQYLDDELSAARATAVINGRSEAIDAERQLHMLEQISAALETPAGAPERHLLTLDAAGTGTAAIVIGDLQTADYVSFLVPGMFYTVEGQMVAWTTAAQDLYDVEVAWVDQLGSTDQNIKDASVATVAWIGYETPSLVNFASLELAYSGRDAITTVVDALRTQRADNEPYLSLIAHSYGSTAAMMALTDYGIDIDSIALIGSPGSAAQTAEDLGVPGNNVYVGEAAWDQVKDSAFFGSDPGSASFDARLFSVDGGVDPLTGAQLAPSVGHDQYLTAGTESLRNLGLVALGQGHLVTTDSGQGIVARAAGPLRQH